MRISAQELVGVGAGVGVWCAVGVTFKGDGNCSGLDRRAAAGLTVGWLLV
jgi:hypothetical protein